MMGALETEDVYRLSSVHLCFETALHKLFGGAFRGPTEELAADESSGNRADAEQYWCCHARLLVSRRPCTEEMMVVEEEEDGVLYVFGRECVPCRRLRSAFAGASRDSQLAVSYLPRGLFPTLKKISSSVFVKGCSARVNPQYCHPRCFQSVCDVVSTRVGQIRLTP